MYILSTNECHVYLNDDILSHGHFSLSEIITKFDDETKEFKETAAAEMKI